MVYYFTSNVGDGQSTIYVGKDKFESKLNVLEGPAYRTNSVPDEELIKYGWDEDVWYRMLPDDLATQRAYLPMSGYAFASVELFDSVPANQQRP